MENFLNKGDLIDVIRHKCNVTEKQANELYAAVFDSITSTVRTGGQVRLQGFGTFLMVNVAARNVKIPKTQKLLAVPERKLLKFRPSQSTFGGEMVKMGAKATPSAASKVTSKPASAAKNPKK